jgi:hypothetical protein
MRLSGKQTQYPAARKSNPMKVITCIYGYYLQKAEESLLLAFEAASLSSTINNYEKKYGYQFF